MIWKKWKRTFKDQCTCFLSIAEMCVFAYKCVYVFFWKYNTCIFKRYLYHMTEYMNSNDGQIEKWRYIDIHLIKWKILNAGV